MKIIVDTNMLMAIEQFDIDLVSELDRVVDTSYEVIIPQTVIKELKNIYKSSEGRDSRAAKIALEFAKRFNVIETSEKGDKAIEHLANELNSVVATNDKELIKNLSSRSIPIIRLRQGSHLEKFKN
ncbi:MAG: rRNA-processing protein FCF1 containing PIN domain [Candidatus Methanohalarchaeum thermophilum]|uniref:rRNA-processing protein FCF1 containing PIN domain n=1 Tax=Methanohalarchaeum thermophilum TaxID=1903181 RepID=A0A1Q6DV86_METT1|nr:MAG: rRNA-processing protein FCF1 containing PIN domain [Candidatus Methanohalarchaeum thermophilum]